MRYLLVLLLIIFPNLAAAQITQQQMLNTIAANLPTNNANEISALLLRNTLDVMTSAIFQGGPIPSGTTCPPVTGLTTFQFFANTTFAPTGTTINIFDGTQCAQFGTLNQTTHQFSIVTSAVTSTNMNVGNAGLAAGNWITTGSWDTIYQFPTVNALRVVSPSAGRSAGFYCRQSDIINPIVNCENLVIQTLIDQAPNPVGTAWNIYEETDVTATTAANVLNREIGFYSLIPSANALAASLPGTFNLSGHTSAIRIGAGAGRTSAGSPNNISTGAEFINNGSAIETGILFGTGSLDVSGRVGQAIAMDDNMGFAWYTSISGGGGTGSSSLVAQIYELVTAGNPTLFFNTGTNGQFNFQVNNANILTAGSNGVNITPLGLTTALTITQSLSGTIGGSVETCTALCININSDTVASGLGVNAIGIFQNFGGSTVTGTRSGMIVELTQTAPTNASNPFPFYVGLTPLVLGSGDGGTNTGAGAKGTYQGMNPQVRSTGANMLELAAAEFDVWGTSAATQHFQFGVATEGIFVNHGATLDAAFVLYMGSDGVYGSPSSPGPGWMCGLCAAELSNGYVPISSGGTFIGTYLGTLSTIPVLNVIDIRGFTPSSQQIFGTGFNIDPSGNISGNELVSNGGAIVAGTAASNAGVVAIANGGAGGALAEIKNPSATVTYNFNLPATAGSSGNVLTSGGGSTNPMTWTAGVSTVCTITVGNTLTFTNGVLTIKGANCT